MPPKRARASSVKKAAEEVASTVEEVVKPHGFEFGGPIGVGILTLFLPPLCYLFAFVCNDVTGCPAPALLHPRTLFSPPLLSKLPYFNAESGWQHGINTLKREVGWPGWLGLINLEAVLGTLAWYGLSLALWALLPATETEGSELRTGGRLKYRFNGFLSSLVIMVACAAGTWVLGPDFQVWSFINRNYVQLLTTNIIVSYALAVYVYVQSFTVKPHNREKRELAAGGHTGSMIYDFFIGRELNPRISFPYFGEVDIKTFNEVRPGMLGWVMLDLAFMAQQYKSYGYVSDSMIIAVAAQFIYTFDALYNEPTILTQIDITTDGFGFMLSFGDLVWVPFIYSLPAKYLSVHPVNLGPFYVLMILAVQGAGYYVFRASNSQKATFRQYPKDPSIQHLKYIQTSNGARLITSGWWGMARHINYLGDWVMSWAYCLPTLAAGYKLTPSIQYPGMRLVSTEGMKGWAIPITYFYLIYFAVLLVHRERRDEEKCRRKYGKDWDAYCKQVKWRIIPGVY